MNKTPFVSAVIPCYNNEQYIGPAIQSMLDQTRTPDEIIVCDDASTDNSWQIISDMADNDTIIKPIQNTENLGTVKTRNKLNQHISDQSDYIAILDSDDISLSDRIETQLNFLQSHAEFIGCGTDMELIDHKGTVIGEKKHTIVGNIKKYVATWNPFVQSSMMLRASIFDLVGSYDETLTRGEDHDMWLRILSHDYKLIIIPEKLTQFRVHPDQGKSAKSNESYRQYALVRRQYVFKKEFFSFKGMMVALLYSVFALIPGSVMVNLYKKKYAK